MKLRKKKTLADWKDVGDGMSIKIDYPTMRQEQKLQSIFSKEDKDFLKYAQLLARYAIKDWQGVDEKCILVEDIENSDENEKATMLDVDLWWMAVSNPENAVTLGNIIWEEIGWTETDKKK